MPQDLLFRRAMTWQVPVLVLRSRKERGRDRPAPVRGAKPACVIILLFAEAAGRMDFIVKNWMLVLVFILSGAMLLFPLVSRRFSRVKAVGTARATQLINQEDALLLDVRETAEYEGGRIPNARHIPLSQLKDRVVELVKYKTRPVIVYDGTGNRSGGAGTTLGKLGFEQVYQLSGGVKAWKDAHLPLQKG